MLERLRLPLKRKRSLSSEEPDSIKKETKRTYLQMTFGILVLLLLVDFSVLYHRPVVMWVFPLLGTVRTYRYRYPVPVLIFNGSGPGLFLGRSLLFNFKKVPVPYRIRNRYCKKTRLGTSPRQLNLQFWSQEQFDGFLIRICYFLKTNAEPVSNYGYRIDRVRYSVTLFIWIYSFSHIFLTSLFKMGERR